VSVRLSFEVFPPKTEAGLVGLAEAVGRLAVLDPVYTSVTYGAGGGQRDKSFAAIDAVRTAGPEVPVAAHLTCVGQSRADVEATIARYAQLGVHHIVALRGDPPEGIDAAYVAHPDGFQSTAELVASIAELGEFEIAVSAYPERHPQSPSTDHDLDVLAAKVDAGATRAMTQMFFDNALFLRYRDRVAARGITVDLVPGIFPIHSFDAVSRFAARCGASMPDVLAAEFAGTATSTELAADLAALQIAELAAEGVGHVHVYTLNKADLALAVCARLGLVAGAEVGS